LKQLEFLFEQSLYPEEIYSFKHALTRDVAYESQLQEQRSRLHAAVARALEVREAERLDEKSGLLAHHWEGAQESGEAARWHLRAAEWAGVADLQQSLAHLEKTRTLLGAEPPDDLAPLALQACSRELVYGLRLSFDMEQLEEIYAQGRALANRLGARDELALLMEAYGGATLFAGLAPEKAIAVLEEAIAIAEDSGAEEAWLAARYRHAWTHFFAVGFREGAELFGAIADDLDGRSLPPSSMLGFDFRSRIEWFCGLSEVMRGQIPSRVQEGRVVDRFADDARARGDYEAELSAYFYGGWCARLRGDLAGARARTRRALEMADESGALTYYSMLSLDLGLVEALDENWEEARVAFERAEEMSFLQPAARSGRGLAEYRLGRRERGLELSDESMEMLQDRGWHSYYDVHGYLSRIRLLLAEDPKRHRDEVEDLIQRTELLLEQKGMGAEAAQPYLARAELAEALGDVTAQRAALERARDAFLAVGATDHAARLPGLD
jgi:tetratricopeptide (TPR) repeat protein